MAEMAEQLFTRGAVGAGDNRGDALMQLHAEKLQRAKEEAAIKAMRRLLPDASPSVWLLALEECDWDVEQATVLINTFTAARASELTEIRKTLQRLLKPEAAAGSDASDESDGDRRKRKKHREDRRESKKQKHSKKSKEKERKHKKARKSEEPTKKDAFGKYGIISEADLSRKYSEFALWASETQRLDLEVLPKLEEKELFRTFCEDYNTATLPHRKYYDLQEYEERKAAAKASKKRMSDDEGEPMVLNDEEDLKRQQAAARNAERLEREREAYLQLKHSAPGKAEDMRQQELLRSQMALAYKTGDRTKVAAIAERLKPDEVKEREAAKRVDPENPLGN